MSDHHCNLPGCLGADYHTRMVSPTALEVARSTLTHAERAYTRAKKAGQANLDGELEEMARARREYQVAVRREGERR